MTAMQRFMAENGITLDTVPGYARRAGALVIWNPWGAGHLAPANPEGRAYLIRLAHAWAPKRPGR